MDCDNNEDNDNEGPTAPSAPKFSKPHALFALMHYLFKIIFQVCSAPVIILVIYKSALNYAFLGANLIKIVLEVFVISLQICRQT